MEFRALGAEQEWPDRPMPAECMPRRQMQRSEQQRTPVPTGPYDADQALVKQIREGNREAVVTMYRLYAPSLLKRLMRLLGGNADQAQDCLQQVFVKALQTIEHYRGDGVLLAWLNRITTHVVMDLFRAEQGWSEILQRLKAPRIMGWGSDNSQAIPEKMFLQEELKSLVHRGLKTIHERKRMPLLLCDLEGYSIQEAADELHVPVGTIASRLHHGRRELRVWLEKALQQRGLSAEEWLHD